MAEPSGIDSDLEGPASPPRDNGEIVFAAPWERRVFGLTIALCRSDACEWESFRQRLIAHIAEEPGRPYWASWASALEDMLADADTLTPAQLDARYRAFMARPAGHDHCHERSRAGEHVVER
jgi:nitrile hydratase accessory protein